MNIYTVTTDFHDSVCELFAEHGEVKLLPETEAEYLGLDIDLLVFTGGEDVNPERYGGYSKGIRFNPKRDEREFSVIHQVIKKKFRPKKVLGICRGLQLINVAMGGTLITDIMDKFGENHGYSHSLSWLVKSPLDFLKETNSLHHQGIESKGDRIHPTVLAIEPRTRVIESIAWGESYLGVQFHPEFFPDNPIRRDMANVVAQWVLGKTSLVTGVNPAEIKSRLAEKRLPKEFTFNPVLNSVRDTDEIEHRIRPEVAARISWNEIPETNIQFLTTETEQNAWDEEELEDPEELFVENDEELEDEE